MDSNCKKISSRGQGGESRRRRDSKLPKCLIYRLNIDIDNNPCFRYRDANWFCLCDTSIGGAKADADTQLTVFDQSASEKQHLILRLTVSSFLGKIHQGVQGVFFPINKPFLK